MNKNPIVFVLLMLTCSFFLLLLFPRAEAHVTIPIPLFPYFLIPFFFLLLLTFTRVEARATIPIPLFPYFLIPFFMCGTAIAQRSDAEKIYKKVTGSVLTLYTHDSFCNNTGQGSGVVIDKKGLVITNFHLVKGGQHIIVKHEDSIIRDVVILEETYAKSALVDRNDIAVKIGYIHLPKFYADFNKTGGRNCAEDIKKELIKLKEEDVDGIILDLRNNRGGSLDDAVKMAGLFIEKGPIVQIKSRTGEPYVLRDRDPMVYYDGPLIIMVNSFSASASEILAAAMQDYKRAIIIGSAATFGKGTVQRLINLDGYLPKVHGDIKSLGTLKLTTQKFYRIDGGATQLKGVYPDIILPDAYSYIDIGAKELEFAMSWDEILPVQFELWKPETKQSNNMDQLKKKSRSRIKKNLTFNLIIENAERFKKQRNKTTYSLNLSIYRDDLKKVNEEAKKYNRIQKEIPELSIHSLKSDLSVIQSDSSKIQRTQAWHLTLKKDAYLFEAMAVINDMM